MTNVDPKIMDVLLHTLGWSEKRTQDFGAPPCRNHFVASPGHYDWAHLVAAEDAGLMERTRRPSFLPEDDVVFRATEEGIRVARSEAIRRKPKLTRSQARYQRYLEEDSSMTFGEWLRSSCGNQRP